jgi:glyoxylase-like metal-dependent hydrolase (beta-lactamase superfamily II)
MATGLKTRPAFAAASLGVDELAPGMALISGAGGNVVVAMQGDALLLVDSGSEAMAPALKDAVTAFSGGKPVTTLFNTHWHLEHTGGNALLAKDGATIVAQENTKGWMSIGFYVRWQDRAYKARPPAARPTKTFSRDGEMPFGPSAVTYGYLPRAHTDGDLYVRFADANLIAAGDVVAVGQYPILDYSTGGWLGEMRDSTKQLLDLCDTGTRIVPGSGPVVGRDHIQKQYDMLATVYDRMVKFIRKGMGADEMIANGIVEGFEDWGDPTLFMHNAYDAVYGHYRDMRIA